MLMPHGSKMNVSERFTVSLVWLSAVSHNLQSCLVDIHSYLVFIFLTLFHILWGLDKLST